MATDRCLRVRDLRVSFRRPGRGPAPGGRAASTSTLNDGEVLGVVGESGSGKSVSMLGILGLLPQVGRGHRLGALPRPGAAGHGAAGAAGDPRRTDRHDLSGPADRAQSRAAGRRADRRGDPHPPRPLAQGRHGARGRSARPGLDPAAARARAAVPARVLRRHAAAGDDRHGGGQRAGAADRRRADHRARRHGPGADPGGAGRACAPTSASG